MRIPPIATLGIEEFSGGEITVPISRVVNGIFAKRSTGKFYVTQRPSLDINHDASVDVTDARGRGIFYWEANSAEFFINDNKVYKGDYNTLVNEAAVTVTDIDGDGTTATATAASHGYKTGDKITIAGASDSLLNGEFVITRTNDNVFTYLSTSSATNDSGTAVRGLGGGGTDRVYFFEIGDYLAIIDPEDNTGWYIAVATSTVLHEIVDTDFPGHHSSSGLSLARGGAVLDGTLYVMDTIGSIAGSDLETPVDWDALNFLTAEVEKDGGVALTKHNNHVVALGNRTIEFFYDARNPTGSPLAARQDIVHEVGISDFDTIWSDQNTMFFVAQTKTGGLTVKQMTAMALTDISSGDLDTFLTSAVQTDNKKLVASGFSTGETVFYIITVYHVTGDIVPLESIVYNTSTGTWTQFELMHTGINDCPLINWTVATDTRLSQGILSNGDVITVSDDYSPYDSVNATAGVYEADTYEEDVYTAGSPGYGTAISMEIITGETDNETTNTKFMSSLRAAGPKTKTSQTLTVQWSDEDNDSYNTGKTIDTSIPGHRINRLGSYRRRNFKLTYAGTEQYELDALEADVKAGNY